MRPRLSQSNLGQYAPKAKGFGLVVSLAMVNLPSSSLLTE
jgi:hypothetical protein